MSFNPDVVSTEPPSKDVAEFFERHETFDVSGLEQENDLIVLTNQISPDELINDEDILRTQELIESGRQEVRGSRYHFNLWDILKKSAINIILPFINGMMLGFGEILAHEIGFKYNWIGARVQPQRRMDKKESKYL